MRPMQDEDASRLQEAGGPEGTSVAQRVPGTEGNDTVAPATPVEGERPAGTEGLASPPAEGPATFAAGTAAPVAGSGEAWFDDLGQPLPARTFDPAVAAEMQDYDSPRPLRIVCMWCNGALESANLDVCPHCGAALKPVSDDIDIPGVTVAPVDLKKARAAAAEAVTRTLGRLSDAVAAPGVRPELEPPNEAVRLAMHDLGAARPSDGATGSVQAEVAAGPGAGGAPGSARSDGDEGVGDPSGGDAERLPG